jgi:hypothetical protein
MAIRSAAVTMAEEHEDDPVRHPAHPQRDGLGSVAELLNDRSDGHCRFADQTAQYQYES